MTERKLNLSKLRKVRPPSYQEIFEKKLQHNRVKVERRLAEKDHWRLGQAKDRTILFQPVWHTDPGSAALRPTHWQACHQGPHRTTRKTHPGLHSSPGYTPLSCCPTWQQASGSDSSNTFEMFVWLHLTLVKVAGANWRTSSTAAYSHLVQPGSCFLDIFAGFNILFPRLLSEMQGQNSCIKDHADRRVCFFLLQSFGHAAEQHPSIPMEHFLDISCSLFTPLVLDSPGVFFGFLSRGMHRPEQWGK